MPKTLRTSAIRLAHADAAARPYILSTLTGSSVFKTAKVAGMNLVIEGRTAEDAAAFKTRFSAALKKTGAADFCKETGLCKGNLGLARKDMPVIEGSKLKDFLGRLKNGVLDISAAMTRGFKAVKSWLTSGDGKSDKVQTKAKTFDPTKLKATQREINADKVNMFVAKYRAGTFDPRIGAVLVSNDGYILDGHHRWAAMVVIAAEDGKKLGLEGYQVDLNVRALLAASNAYTDAAGITRKSF